ncbi:MULTISPECIES: FAD-binding oxidoreductase [unclassified Chelatococcus]|uniref:FAD-binding oxidoreductase n=1 Tax=unclassified Chelatococcus TaxID=2638111 RepID=UPI001BD1AB25|nr:MULTISPECIES: FAD-binding oxidoreductase [unclassified Chelatococcus]MBS7700722.1 FAD-binding oxidoreductase [Chelatococcus sp. YT9]MBX3559306.1 FAD-binding oxidoreductase [Chelatococcus sp.]
MLADNLMRIAGRDNVLFERVSQEFGGSDLFVWSDQVIPDLVVKPSTTDEVSRIVSLITASGTSIVSRGAGLSYSAGVVPACKSVVIDTKRIDHVHVAADDLYAIVGAGCTWQRLADVLKPYGLRPHIAAPLSGSHSTVGGAVSQNVPGSMDGIIGLTVVLADGSAIRTGSWAIERSVPFYRNNGPDLTGLFLGDCGAFGVKTEVALRLIPERPSSFASFTFPTTAAMLSALIAVQHAGVASRCFVIDRDKGELAGKVNFSEAVRTAGAVAAQAGSFGRALRDVTGLKRAQSEIASAPWSMHLIMEGVSEAAAEASATVARGICHEHGTEIAASIAKAARARPFSLRGFLGPGGERWVPVHGLLALSSARKAMNEMEAYAAEATANLLRHNIRLNWFLSSQGAYVLIEPMMYWPDEVGPVHDYYLPIDKRPGQKQFPANPAAREIVTQTRAALRDIMDRHGAVHLQSGRYYNLADAMDAPSRGLLERIKAMLDPSHRLNPHVLGL